MLKTLIFLLCLLFSQVALADINPVVKSTLKASAKVYVGEKSIIIASAIAIDHFNSGTIFVTNDHVCQWTRGKSILGMDPNYSKKLNSIPIFVRQAYGGKMKAKVVYTSQITNPKLEKESRFKDDLCLLYVSGDSPFVELGEDPETGEEVLSISSPHGFFPLITSGYVGGYLEDYTLGTASINLGKGSSGSGIFDSKTGILKGVVFAIHPVSENEIAALFTLFVPVSHVSDFLKNYKQFIEEQKEDK